MAAKGFYSEMHNAFAKKIDFKRIVRFSAGKKTPFLVLDLKKVAANYDALHNNLPFASIFYAVKANPHPEIIKLLSRKGANFDIASIYEFNELLHLGVSPSRVSFGNTIKKSEDIEYFFKKGVRLYATDSESDLKKIAKHAPGAKVFFRLWIECVCSDWPLSKKFGAHPDLILNLAVEAKKLGLVPYGLSFHVGSQQRDVEQWDEAIAQCRHIFEGLAKKGIHLQMINLGGGLPSHYLVPTPNLRVYASRMKSYLSRHFGKKMPKILIEPGRYMVGNAGVIVTEIVLISKKAESMPYEWMYLDCGMFTGLDETAGEAVKYPILCEAKAKTTREFVLAGPTCDSHDILYEKFLYSFPSSIKEGSRLYFATAGAYTYQVSSIGFNGFPPLKVYVMR
jgi:ornithine decarboxylase